MATDLYGPTTPRRVLHGILAHYPSHRLEGELLGRHGVALIETGVDGVRVTLHDDSEAAIEFAVGFSAQRSPRDRDDWKHKEIVHLDDGYRSTLRNEDLRPRRFGERDPLPGKQKYTGSWTNAARGLDQAMFWLGRVCDADVAEEEERALAVRIRDALTKVQSRLREQAGRFDRPLDTEMPKHREVARV